ncbi:MAG: PEP-CTERM sorting domain-containing protein [Planctomycetaceae bacterium]|nr:PEP-CTERM sorting domain-containing protein [Planctomycetaceae bacterium]
MKAHKSTLPLLLGISLFLGNRCPGDVLTWDGGGVDNRWATVANWNPDQLPGAGDTINIANGDTVAGLEGNTNGSLPNAVINLTNNSTLTTSTEPIRLSGTTINVSSGSSLTGNFWDLRNGTLNFSDGAVANMNDWEIKGANTFRFDLGATGFTTLNPNNFRTDGNNTALTVAQKVALSTWTVDLNAYIGGVGVITLVDFNADQSRSGMVNGDTNDAIFQTATLNVLNNNTGHNAALRWNDLTEAVELNITAVPEPSTFAMIGIVIGGLLYRRRKSRTAAAS